MTVSEDYCRGRHVVSGLHVHVVLVTTYRWGVLTGEHIRYLAAVFGKVRTDVGAIPAQMQRGRRPRASAGRVPA